MACVRALNAVRLQGQSLAQQVPWAQQQVAPEDRPTVQALLFGCCRWYFPLLDEINQRLQKPCRRQDRLIEDLLLIALYQLRFSQTPAHAVIHEAVETCRLLERPHLTGLVNAVLRSAQREGAPAPTQAAALYSHPAWMLAKLQHNWPHHWQQILAANNQQAPMTLRVNLRHGTRDAYLARLAASQIQASASLLSDCGILLAQPCAVEQLPGFSDGDVSLQDEAAQLCAQWITPKGRVLDACAAPGGKTCALLERHPDIASLLALDLDAHRLTRVQQNLTRLQLHSNRVQVRQGDAGQLADWWDNQPFDYILLDAPCSGSGVIRRHPDIKLLRRETDITALANLQCQLLGQLWQTLKTGGQLLYATCSVFPQENQRIIKRFLDSQPEASLLPLPVAAGATAAGTDQYLLDTGYGQQFLPMPAGHDGFFYALLGKT